MRCALHTSYILGGTGGVQFLDFSPSEITSVAFSDIALSCVVLYCVCMECPPPPHPQMKPWHWYV